MEYKLLLSRTENTKQVMEQEQARFIKSVLEQLEVPIEYDPELPLSIEQHQKMRKELRDFDLSIVRDPDGGMIVYLDKRPIAEWYKSTYVLKQDLSELDPKDRLYLEMSVSFWTIFDKEGEEEPEDLNNEPNDLNATG